MNILLVGFQGTGKTLLSASAAAVQRVEGILYIDVDKGVKTGLDAYIRKYPNKFHVVYVGDNLTASMIKFIRYLRIATNREQAAATGIPYINMVVIDSITALADKLISRIAGSEVAIEAGNLPDGARIQDWGTQKTIIESWVNTIKDMPCHLIVTCLEHIVEDEKTHIKTPQLHLPAKLATKLPSLFDQVLYLALDAKVAPSASGDYTRSLQCKADLKRMARDRSRRLPASMSNPTMSQLFDLFYA